MDGGAFNYGAHAAARMGLRVAAILVIWLALVSRGSQSKGASSPLLTLPSLAFDFWSPVGVLPRSDFGRVLARFAVPVGVSISVVGSGVYLFFLERGGESAYAQLALT